MAKVITTELQHSGASGANLTLDSSKNVTCQNNLTVDGTTTLTGAVELPDDTVDIADLSASGTASSSTFLRGDNSWAAAGKILQVVGAKTTTLRDQETSTWTDTHLTCNITPSSGTKVLVVVMQHIQIRRANDTVRCGLRLMRDSTEISAGNSESYGMEAESSGAPSDVLKWEANIPIIELDTHGADGSTAVTYKTQVSNETDSDGGHTYCQPNSLPSTITLIEVA